MPVNRRSRFGAGDDDLPSAMDETGAVTVDPLPAAMDHGGTDAVDADSAVVVAADRKHPREAADPANQHTQPDQLRATVDQVAAKQNPIPIASSDRIEYLPAQHAGTTLPEMNVADIQQSTRVGPRRQPLFANVQGSAQSDFEHSAEPGPSPVGES
jgi:hypothetical protein